MTNLAINQLISVRIKLAKGGTHFILRSKEGKVGFITNSADYIAKQGVQVGQDWACQVMQDGERYFKAQLKQPLQSQDSI